MNSRRLALILCIYAACIAVLMRGVLRLDTAARSWYFDVVTRHLVTTASGVPGDKCVLGLYRPELPYSFSSMRTLERVLDTRFTIVSFYVAWGDQPAHRFPGALLDAVDAQGCVPMITWEPWVSEFSNDNTHLRPMPMREYRSLADIAAGSYDFYIEAWARDAVAWGKPLLLRFAHEMTNPQYPWTPSMGNRPQDYTAAWWHVRAIFDSLGARNVAWVWSPYKVGSLEYYPGESQVDWTAMDVFNYGHFEGVSGEQRWWSFDQLAGPLYRELAALRKPIMVAEAGSTDFGGSKEIWYRDMMVSATTDKYRYIKAVILFDNPADRTSGRHEIDWTISRDNETTVEMTTALRGGHFVFIERFLKQTASVK